MKCHKLIFYRDYFEDFLDQQRPKVKQKILEVLISNRKPVAVAAGA